MSGVSDQITYFDLIEQVRLILRKASFDTLAIGPEKPGLFRTNLELGDG
ncbi:hypothetical protein AK972_3682 [Pseudomonas yamanorum]|nr:hypothetical protein AK972_3682 [Pseudomonas yamanorum]